MNTYRLTLDNANGEPGAVEETVTGTLLDAERRASDMWNAHPVAVISPGRGWRLRVREQITPKRLSRILIEIG